MNMAKLPFEFNSKQFIFGTDFRAHSALQLWKHFDYGLLHRAATASYETLLDVAIR
jgi:hypothetical protein